MQVGRLCVKIAGRDAGKKCVIVDVLDNNFVLIDGETRRRKCNVQHLEPLNQVAELKSGASHEEVARILAPLGFEVRKTKPKQAAPRKLKVRVKKGKRVAKVVKQKVKGIESTVEVAPAETKLEKVLDAEKPKEATKKTVKKTTKNE